MAKLYVIIKEGGIWKVADYSPWQENTVPRIVVANSYTNYWEAQAETCRRNHAERKPNGSKGNT
jgi:hypothetical protein